MSKFLDQAFIEVRSGDGGNGIVAWRREKYEPMGGPAGGNGGRGGSVYLEATEDLNTLIDFRFKRKFEASNGARGRPKGMHGKGAEDLTIKVPVGTLVRDAETKSVIADLVRSGQRVLVAEGGKGGLGNVMLASPTKRAPHHCEPGQPGIERKLELELKVLADVGIIGLPNAGKSTLLSVISRARPKIADYPFSTLEPNLGVVKTDGGSSFVVADIPGLVEGASQGIGLGHDFLRHVERTRILIHLVDITQDDPAKAIATINDELRLHEAGLEKLPQILALNKVDVIGDELAESIREDVEKALQSSARGKKDAVQTPTSIQLISAAATSGVKQLMQQVEEALARVKPSEPEPETVYYDPKATERVDAGFMVTRKNNIFYVQGDRVERVVGVTNMRDPDALTHMYRVLRAMGVVDELMRLGVQQGSEVVVGKLAFTFGGEG
ncbi:MAG TPA: GTPase ObgE [Chroococcales cyanobacterium]